MTIFTSDRFLSAGKLPAVMTVQAGEPAPQRSALQQGAGRISGKGASGRVQDLIFEGLESGQAVVDGPAENCQYTAFTLDRLGDWLEKQNAS